MLSNLLTHRKAHQLDLSTSHKLHPHLFKVQIWAVSSPPETLDPALPFSISVTAEVHQAPRYQDTVKTNDNTAAFSNKSFFLFIQENEVNGTHSPTLQRKHITSTPENSSKPIENWRPEQWSPTDKQQHHKMQNPFPKSRMASPMAVSPNSPWQSAQGRMPQYIQC